MNETGEGKSLGARAGERVRDARTARGWNQSDLHRKSGVSVTFISRLEAGHYDSPSVAHLEKIARALGLRVTDLADIAPLPAEGAGLRAELRALGYRPDEAPQVDRIVTDLLRYTPRQRRQILDLMKTAIEIAEPTTDE